MGPVPGPGPKAENIDLGNKAVRMIGHDMACRLHFQKQIPAPMVRGSDPVRDRGIRDWGTS